MEQLLPHAYGFVLLLFRTVAMASAVPIVSEAVVTPTIRIGFAAAVTAPIYLGAGMPAVSLPSSMGGLVEASFVETILGLSAGLSCRLIANAAQAAGSIAGTSMGLSFGAQVDPFSGAQSTAVAQIFTVLGLGALIACGLPREAVLWLCRQAMETPPGHATDLRAIAGAVVTQATTSAALGYRLAFPFLATVNFGHMALGFISKSAPQINLHSIGFSVTIGIGGLMIYLAAPEAADLVAQATLSVLTRS